MFLPQISAVNKTVNQTVQFLGLNKGLTTTDGEMSHLCGLTSTDFPVLATRKRRASRTQKRGRRYRISKDNMIYEFGYDGEIVIYTFDGREMHRYQAGHGFGGGGNNVISAAGVINKDILIMPYREIYTIDNKLSTMVLSHTDIELYSKLFATHDNRLWCCNDYTHEIYASKLGDPKSWKSFEGLVSDSYAVTVGSDGDFTGSALFQGYVHFFKENLIIRVYGNKPANYQLNTMNQPGVKANAEQTICEINGHLYYLSPRGVIRFDGSQAVIISNNLGQRFKGKYAGALGTKYYITLKVDDDEEYKIYCYDTEKSIWHVEDVMDCSYIYSDSHLLMMYQPDNNLVNMTFSEIEYSQKAWEDAGVSTSDQTLEAPVNWHCVFAPTLEGSFNDKYISKIQLHCETDEDTVFQIDIKYDNQCDFQTIGTFRGLKRETKNIPIIPKRHQRFQIRLQGTGGIKLYGYTRTISYPS